MIEKLSASSVEGPSPSLNEDKARSSCVARVLAEALGLAVCLPMLVWGAIALLAPLLRH